MEVEIGMIDPFKKKYWLTYRAGHAGSARMQQLDNISYDEYLISHCPTTIKTFKT